MTDIVKTLEDALEVIKKQKAEIERLKSMNQAKLDTIHDLMAEVERLKAVVVGTENSFNKMTELYHKAFKRYKTAKAEAIKEFAERAENISVHGNIDVDDFFDLVKEMTEVSE